MNTTAYSYSREEVAEAREGLRLLKNKMAMSGIGMRKSMSNSTATRSQRVSHNNSYVQQQEMHQRNTGMPPFAGSSGFSNASQRRLQYSNSNFGGGSKPPMMPPHMQTTYHQGG